MARICRRSAWSFTCLSIISLSAGFWPFVCKEYLPCLCCVKAVSVEYKHFQHAFTSAAMESFRYSSSHLSFVFLFSFQTRRLQGESSFRLYPLRKSPLEDILFLNGIQLKTQHMLFKSFMVTKQFFNISVQIFTRLTRSMEKDMCHKYQL